MKSMQISWRSKRYENKLEMIKKLKMELKGYYMCRMKINSKAFAIPILIAI